FYTLEVLDNSNFCSVNTITSFINAAPKLLEINFDPVVRPSDCALAEGVLTAWVELNGDALSDPPVITNDEIPNSGNFRFTWFFGLPTSSNPNFYEGNIGDYFTSPALNVDPNDIYTTGPVAGGVQNTDYFQSISATNGATIYEKVSGTYTVVVEDLRGGGTGCIEYASFFLPFVDAQVTTLVEKIDDTDCDPNIGNGSIEVIITESDGITPVDQSKYDVLLFNSTTPDLTSYASATADASLVESIQRSGYSSDFSTDEDGWDVASNKVGFVADQDNVEGTGVNDALKVYMTSTGNNHQFNLDHIIVGREITLSFRYYLPSTNASMDGFTFGINGAPNLDLRNGAAVYDIWSPPISITFTPTGTTEFFKFYDGLSQTINSLDDPNDDLIYFTDYSIVDTNLPETIFRNLPPGDYSVVSYQDFGSNCPSELLLVEIKDAAQPPVLTPTIVHDTWCDNSGNNGDGRITVTPSINPIDIASDAPNSEPRPRTSYTYVWSTADGTAAVNGFTETVLYNPVGPVFSSSTITGLAPGNYQVTVTDDDTGCQTVASYEIIDQDVDPALATFGLSPSDKCSPDENGVIEINLNNITPNTGAPTIADYAFNLYLRDDATNALNLQTEGVANDYVLDVSADPTIQFQGLTSGTYFLEIQMLNSTLQGFGCVSPPIEAGEILDISVDPVVDELITADNSCSPIATGEIRVEANPASVGVYTFNWYVGTDNTAPGFVDGVDGNIYGPGDTHPIDGLVPDDVVYISDLTQNNYTVEIMDPDTKCITTESYIVDYIPLAPTITATSDDQTQCDDGVLTVNGQISITPAIDAVGDYTYELFESLTDYNNDNPSTNVTGLNSGVFTELSAGTYYVTATKFQGAAGGLGCETPAVSVVIQDETVQPSIAITPFSNTSCDGNFEGSFTILMSTTGGPGDDANNPTYTYTVTGALTGPIAGGPFVGDGDDDGTDGDNDEFTGIQDDTYTIVATNNLSGCSVTGIVTIQKVEEPIIIQTVDFDNRTTCDLPTGGGSAEVVAITPLGANPINTEYTFEWYETSLGGDFANASPRAETVSSITQLDQGTYYVVAVRNAGFSPGSGCESPPYRVDIADDSVDPTFTATTSANTSCDPGAGEGSLLISNVVGVGDFDLEITGATSGVVLARTNDAVLGGFPYTAGGLGEDTYTITIYDNGTECFLTQEREIVLSEQPIIITNGSSTDQEYCDETAPGGGGSVTLTGVTPLTGASIVAEYEIFWYRGALGDDFATASALSGGVPTDTDVETLTDLAEGTYYVQVRRRLGQVPGAGCESAPFRLDVFDVSTAPTFTATTSANTSCDPGSGEGSLVVDNFVGEGTSFDITIDIVDAGGVFQSNVSTTLGYDFSGGIAYTELGLGEGFYQITVRDATSDCSLIQTREILFSQQPIIITNGSSTDQEYCDETLPGGGGSVTLSGVTPLTGASIVAEYEIFWYRGALGDDFATASALSGGVPTDTDVETLTDLAEGTYYVQVRRRLGQVPGAGCESAPFRLDVFDVSTAPTFTATTSANTSCDPGSSEGSLVVDNFVGEGTSFDITIDLVDAGGVFQSNVSTTLAYDFSGGIAYTESNLGEGFYQITVRDVTSDCFQVQTREILFSQQPIIIQTVSSTDQTLCDPFNGTATVTSVSPLDVDGLGNTIDDEYTFEWFETSLGGDFASANPRAEITTSIAGLPEGTYYVRATRGAFGPGAGCVSAPFRVDVFDVSEDPILSYQIPEPDINCFTDATQGNGSVTVNSSVDIVTWDWFERDLNDNGIFNEAVVDDEPLTADDTNFTATSITYSGLAPGTYRLMATDVNGCENTTEVEIIRDATQSTPNVLAVDIIKTTTCGGNGSFEIVEISLGNPNDASNPNASITDPIRIATEFSYQWFFETIDAAGELVGEVGPSLSDVAEGSYFVIVTNIATTCESIPKEVVMEGDEINYPNIVLEQTVPQLSCQSPPSGELTATITEDNATVPAGPYTFEWLYEGGTLPINDATGRPIEPVITGNISVLDSLPVGRFDVTVTNQATGCTVTALFIIENESEEFIPVINTGTEPVTNCVSPNGGIFGKAVPFTDANGVNTYPLLPYDYDIDIYTGDLSGTLTDTSPPGDLASVSGTSAGVNLLASNVPAGFYTVRIIDNKTGCYSVKADQVFDRQTVPVVEVVEDNPLINCDPARANGQLSATADGGRVGGFDFRWHAGTDTTSTVIGNQNRLIGQGAGVFTVVVTNQTSGCIAVMSGEITDGTLPAPTPTPELISDRQSCIEPDGSLNVSVDGETAGYTFNWYDDADGGGTMISDNPFIINLDIGNYSVVAINNTTGCESLPANISVGDARLDPEFTFETEGSKCDEDTGLARIIITNEALVNEVFWTDLTSGAGLGLGSEINFLAPGDYQADVTTFYGCEGTGTATVGTVITNYNLVTSDGDGFNDNFQIDCITNFPNNNVKIFNRAGVLVYQIDGYNNEDKSFVGLGEDGIYPIGEELPNGTYYYVIDKRDGSELIAGFLELIR
ncbi:gliding motility-associated C-terminal domain-containing protein, partial [Fulvivirga lutimaris]|uniref:gliding motility-associated C-terminal domain-containing protein n=1 Tax=Fulvivirga lutimaris TaxID=1819566 RepID=UPI0012BBF1AF